MKALEPMAIKKRRESARMGIAVPRARLLRLERLEQRRLLSGGQVEYDSVDWIEVSNPVVLEDNGSTAVFSLYLHRGVSPSLTIDYETVNGSAKAGEDYDARSGQFTYYFGSEDFSVNVPIRSDTELEPDETFSLRVWEHSYPGNDLYGTATILDDDAAQPTLRVGDRDLTETRNGVGIPVYLAPAAAETVTVDYETMDVTATAGEDYTAVQGQLTFTPGQTYGVIGIETYDDSTDEYAETFTVRLTNPVHAVIGRQDGEVTIRDDDGPPSVSIEDAAVVEGDSGQTLVAVRVFLSAPSGKTIQMDYHSSPDTATSPEDFQEVSGELVFQPGETEKNVLVPVVGDTELEGNEKFRVWIGSTENAYVSDGLAAVQILNDDPPFVSVEDATAPEVSASGAVAEFNVTLSHPYAYVATVDWRTQPGTATPGVDYEAASGQVIFQPGETAQTIEVPIYDDEEEEAPEHFTVELYNPSGTILSDAEAEGTILDDDAPPPGVSIEDVTVVEGDSGQTDVAIRVFLSAASSKTIYVDYHSAPDTATSPEDFHEASGELVFQPGETEKNVHVPVVGDTELEGNEVFRVSIETSEGAYVADGLAAVQILNDDPPFVSVDDATASEVSPSGAAAEFNATLSHPYAYVATVDWRTQPGTATAGVDYEAASGQLTFQPGETEQTIDVPIHDDEEEESPELFTVELYDSVGAVVLDGEAEGTILDDDSLVTVSLGQAVAFEGDAGDREVYVPVRLSPASGRTVTVDFRTVAATASPAEDYDTTVDTGVFLYGTTVGYVSVPILGDTLEEGNETFIVELTGAEGATIRTATAVVTIVDDEGPEIELPGTDGDDEFRVTTGLGAGSWSITRNGLRYDLTQNITRLDIDTGAGHDSVEITGTDRNEVATIAAGSVVLERPGVFEVVAIGVEDVSVIGGLGNDVYRMVGDGVRADISDNGGNDTLDFSGLSQPVSVNLAGLTPQVATPAATLTVHGQFENAVGTDFDDVLYGNDVANRLEGGAGADLLAGFYGNDILDCGDGDDVAIGGPDNDFLYGQGGDDRLFGREGLDFLVGHYGNDVLRGEEHNDDLFGGAGDDTLFGEDGDDVIRGQGWDDLIHGGRGDDHILGGAGQDILFGNAGNDNIRGGTEGDFIRGCFGNDVVRGDEGDDRIFGGFNRDLVIGGAGVDQVNGEGLDDILIGGTTDHDANNAALLAILFEWQQATPIDERIDHITGAVPGGLNEPYFLNPGTLHDDGQQDTLTGETGQDWFAADTGDVFSDKTGIDR